MAIAYPKSKCSPSLIAAAALAVAAVLSVGAAAAQTATDLRSALTERSRTRSATSAPAPSAADVATVDKLFARRTRGVVVEPVTPKERETLATVARMRPTVDMTVNFAYDSAAISTDADATLRMLGEALAHADLADTRFMIAGHTDGKGTAVYNQALSERRAEAVRLFLIENFKLQPERLLPVGYGLEQLKVTADPLAAANRRVQVTNLGSRTRGLGTGVAPPPAMVTPAKAPATAARTRSATVDYIDKALDEIAGQTRPTKGTAAGASPGAVPPAPAAASTGNVTVETLRCPAPCPEGDTRTQPTTAFQLDDLMIVRITSRIAGTLIVHEQDAAGAVTQIFPNAHSGGGGPGEARTTIKAGEAITVPGPADRFRLRVSPPAGASRIIAIVLPEGVKVDDLAPPTGGMQPVKEPEAVYQQLVTRSTRGVKVEPTTRAVAVHDYLIGP